MELDAFVESVVEARDHDLLDFRAGEAVAGFDQRLNVIVGRIPFAVVDVDLEDLAALFGRGQIDEEGHRDHARSRY